MNNDKLAEIAEQMILRYSGRYNKMGYNVQTLGWGSTEQQRYRFAQSLSVLDFSEDKSIVDIGCGFGDYLAVLKASEKPYQKYYGWDINPDLIGEAKNIWLNEAQAEFSVRNLGMMNEFEQIADIGVMFGVLNLNLEDKIDNYEYSRQMIENAYKCVKEVLVVDFLSSHYAPDYPVEPFVFYHEPGKMLDFALSLSPNVILKHNYAPIPQKEFMLFIYK